jgi:hypothetical protein
LRLELSFRTSTPTLRVDFSGDAELVRYRSMLRMGSSYEPHEIRAVARIVSWTSCRTDARARRPAARPAGLGGGGAERAYIAGPSESDVAQPIRHRVQTTRPPSCCAHFLRRSSARPALAEGGCPRRRSCYSSMTSFELCATACRGSISVTVTV